MRENEWDIWDRLSRSIPPQQGLKQKKYVTSVVKGFLSRSIPPQQGLKHNYPKLVAGVKAALSRSIPPQQGLKLRGLGCISTLYITS